jgi:hypothetical protein
MPTEPEFFIDRSLGRKHLANALRELGLVVHTLTSVYGEEAGQALDDIDRIRRQAEQPGPYIYGVYDGYIKRLWP